MHKQDNSVKDPGLDTIVESMYQKEADDTGRIPHDVDSFDTKKKEYDSTKSPWYKDDPENDANIARDKHSQNLQTITPLDELAKKYGADNIIDWLAQGIKDQGQNWIDDFEERNMREP